MRADVALRGSVSIFRSNPRFTNPMQLSVTLSTRQPVNPSTYQPINPSTRQPAPTPTSTRQPAPSTSTPPTPSSVQLEQHPDVGRCAGRQTYVKPHVLDSNRICLVTMVWPHPNPYPPQTYLPPLLTAFAVDVLRIREGSRLALGQRSRQPMEPAASPPSLTDHQPGSQRSEIPNNRFGFPSLTRSLCCWCGAVIRTPIFMPSSTQ